MSTAAASRPLTPLVPLQAQPSGPTWQFLETGTVLFLLGFVALSALLLVAAVLSKAVRNRRRARRETRLETSVRQTVFEGVVATDTDWETVVAEFTERERDVLVGLLERGTELLTGTAAEDLTALAEAIDLRALARSKVESDRRAERLRGLSLFIEFGWTADPEWLLECTSADRDEAEAAIRILGNEPNPVTRLAGVELAMRQPSLSVYGTDALSELLEDDPAPLLEQLDRQDVEEPELLAQLLRVLVHTETATGDAPMGGVLACLDHDSPLVRGAACAVLGKYGWRSEVRDQADLVVSDLFDDPSVRVRIQAYEMLASWGDTAARAKLARAARSETNSRALFAIARGLGSEARLFLGPDGSRSIKKQYGTWTEVRELDIGHPQRLP